MTAIKIAIRISAKVIIVDFLGSPYGNGKNVPLLCCRA
jgi:hypothetical protein